MYAGYAPLCQIGTMKLIKNGAIIQFDTIILYQHMIYRVQLKLETDYGTIYKGWTKKLKKGKTAKNDRKNYCN